MLDIRPNCEMCDKDLPPASMQARICSYECTFCADCVENRLFNVCPNCGGGFQPRPVRPSVERRDGVGLQYQPASSVRTRLKYDVAGIPAFVARLRGIPPAQR